MGRPEGTVEDYFFDKCRANGILALKLYSEGRQGFPDRTCLHYPGMIFFVELKAKGKGPRKNQGFWHRVLRQLGFKVYVVDTKEKADQVIKAQLERAQISTRMRKKRSRSKVSRLLARS